MEDLERLRRQLTTVERQLESDQAAVHQRKAALDRLVELLGPTWTPRREELEVATRTAESALALRQQQRDDLVARIEREQKTTEAERAPATAPEQERRKPPPERAKDVEFEIDF
jgi:multidrug resistance efflux pump